MWGTGVNLLEIEVTDRSSQKVHCFFKMHWYQGSLSIKHWGAKLTVLDFLLICRGSSKLWPLAALFGRDGRKIGFYSIPGTHKSSLLSLREFLCNQISQFFLPLHLAKQNPRVTVILKKLLRNKKKLGTTSHASRYTEKETCLILIMAR